MKKVAIDPAEWDFVEVAAGEIDYCCLYEYAREAEIERWTVAERALSVRVEAASTRGPYSVELRKRIEANAADQMARPGFVFPWFQPATSKQTETGKRTQPARPAYKSPRPWKKLTAKERLAVVETIAIADELRPAKFAITQIGPSAIAGGVASCQLLPVADDLSLAAGLNGGAAVSLMLDIRNCNDNQIVDTFRALLKIWRGHLTETYGDKFAGPGKAGSKTDAWVRNLDNLAIMRLRHAMDFDRMVEVIKGHRLSEIWSATGTMAEKREAADKRRERALEKFRALCPELGKESYPEHWITYLQRAGSGTP